MVGASISLHTEWQIGGKFGIIMKNTVEKLKPGPQSLLIAREYDKEMPQPHTADQPRHHKEISQNANSDKTKSKQLK